MHVPSDRLPKTDSLPISKTAQGRTAAKYFIELPRVGHPTAVRAYTPRLLKGVVGDPAVAREGTYQDLPCQAPAASYNRPLSTGPHSWHCPQVFGFVPRQV